MTKFLGLRKVYDVDPTKPFMVADVLEDGAILPHSVLLSDLPVLSLESLDDITELEKPQCVCYEYMGDNLDCPIHGEYFTKADQQERNDIYTIGMGA